MDRIKWGIIGCGEVTEVKSGPGFQNAAGSELVAVMRRNSRLAMDYAARHHVPKWYDDADSLINDPDVDAVYVATPPAFHKDYVIRCAKAGKPVYVEKPMATTYEDCQEMLAECRKHRVPLFVAYYRRSLDYFRKVKQLVDSKAIGDVRFVTITHCQKPMEKGSALPWRLIPEISGGGLFFDVAPHTLDLMDYLFGPIKSAAGLSANQAGSYDAADIVSADFEFSSGVVGSGVWCFGAFENHDTNEIVGSKGKITFSTFSETPIRIRLPGGGVQEYVFENPEHVQQPLIQAVVDELCHHGTAPGNGVSASRTNWVMEQILKHPPQPC